MGTRIDRDQVWRMREDGTMELIEEIEVEREESNNPDYQGFLLGALQEIGNARTNEVLRQYPLMSIAASRENAAVLRATFDQALADEFLSLQEYDTLQALMTQYHIPNE